MISIQKRKCNRSEKSRRVRETDRFKRSLAGISADNRLQYGEHSDLILVKKIGKQSMSRFKQLAKSSENTQVQWSLPLRTS